MTTITLNLSTWRSGGDEGNINSVGIGETSLCNFQHFQCCLGQFLFQIDKIPVTELLDKLTPRKLDRDNIFNRTKLGKILSTEAMGINDNATITVEDRIIQLKFLFALFGFNIITTGAPVLNLQQ